MSPITIGAFVASSLSLLFLSDELLHCDPFHVSTDRICPRNSGYLLYYELYLYIIDSLLMFLTMVVFNVVHLQEIGEQLCRPVQCEMTAEQV